MLLLNCQFFCGDLFWNPFRDLFLYLLLPYLSVYFGRLMVYIVTYLSTLEYVISKHVRLFLFPRKCLACLAQFSTVLYCSPVAYLLAYLFRHSIFANLYISNYVSETNVYKLLLIRKDGMFQSAPGTHFLQSNSKK